MKTQFTQPFGRNVRPDLAKNTKRASEEGLDIIFKMGAINFKDAQNDELVFNQKENGLDSKF